MEIGADKTVDILLDIAFLVGAVLFFGVSWAFVHMCAWLRPTTEENKH